MKKNNKTKAEFERHLNELYNDLFSYNQAIDEFQYLTNKDRGPHCTKTALSNSYHKREMGTLLRKYDSIAFLTAFNDWK